MQNLKNIKTLSRTKKLELNKMSENKIDDLVNEFALYVYHNSLLDSDWKISKELLREAFLRYCVKNDYSFEAKNFRQFQFLSKLEEQNISRNGRNSMDNYVYFKYNKIYDIENSFVEKYDRKQIQEHEEVKTLLKQMKEQTKTGTEKVKLEWKSLFKTSRNLNFTSKFCACDICQKNFLSEERLNMHMCNHSYITGFEWLKRNHSSNIKSNLEFSYEPYNNQSNLLKFTLTLKQKNINIERILTVKSNKLITLEANYKTTNEWINFIANKNIFDEDTEQPIVIIYHLADLNTIFIEHYFINLPSLISKCESLKSDLSKNISQRVSTQGHLPYFNLANYIPEENIKLLYVRNQKRMLISYNKTFSRYYHHENQKLNISNAAEVLNFLLQLEDIEEENCYIKLTQNEASINRTSGIYYSVKLITETEILIEDLLKARDEIKLKWKENNKIQQNIGIIKRINNDTVEFEIKNRKDIDLQKKYTIEFCPNRLSYQLQYYAIEKLKSDRQLQAFLFPTNSTIFKNTPANIKLNLINKSIEINPEQKEAVTNIVQGIKNLPYILEGPPGTGKTTTIVESILQVKLHHPNYRILLMAGSNTACDEVAKRLVKLIEKGVNNLDHIKLLRLYAKSYEKSDNIDQILMKSSNLAHGYHFYPSFETISKYDIIVCTLSVIGRLRSSGMPENFFQYCFIDECAATTETETLVGISSVFHSQINIILAGDEKQLGPILKSKLTSNLGLKYSIIERLLNNNECYQITTTGKRHYNRRIHSKLIRNFRNHPDILEMSNRLFYENELKACGSIDRTHWAVNWYCLPEREVPIIFHCVDGYTKQEKNSTSFHNPREVEAVMQYIKKLMYFKTINGIKEDDIGVITPYKKQNLRIKEELKKRGWYQIATGSVESFQGQEKPVIIISTVRSLRSDKEGVGFLDDIKRLNVMLTRAQALLIIVGDPEQLRKINWKWKEAIDYCINKKTLKNLSKFIESRKSQTNGNSLQKNIDLKLDSKKEREKIIIPKAVKDKIIEDWIQEHKNYRITNLLKPNSTVMDNFLNDPDSISLVPSPLSDEYFSSTAETKRKKKKKKSCTCACTIC